VAHRNAFFILVLLLYYGSCDHLEFVQARKPVGIPITGTGTATRCARAASGHAIAAPPSPAINSRRPIVTGI
jgi:hypothetical protein